MVIRNCISAVQTGEERIDMSDVPEQEIEEFIDPLVPISLNHLVNLLKVCNSRKEVEFT
ncbi:MAG: hypothetical protein CM15mV16_1760 [uncultured marine virus]|nr:MAG: hypothetical protein CM15mV16_1760 [uncultured marine virus]